MDKFGFKNFRKFDNFPIINLGGVNILVGTNNAGKSTFAKAACIYLDFLKKWDNGVITLDFECEICRRLNINSFGDALSRFADERGENAITFSMTIGRYNYTAVFKGEKKQTKVNAQTMTLVDQENNNEFVFDYKSMKFSVNIYSAITQLRTDHVDSLSRYLFSPRTDKQLKGIAADNHLDKCLEEIHDAIEKNEFTQDTMTSFDNVCYILEQYYSDSYTIPGKVQFDNFKILHKVFSQIVDGAPVFLSFKIETERWQDCLKIITGMMDTDPVIYFPNKTELSGLYFDYCHVLNLNQRKYYSIYDTEDLSKTIVAYNHNIVNYKAKHKANSADSELKHVKSFIDGWLNKLDIGSELVFYHDEEGDVYRCKVKFEDGTEVPLHTLGMGSIHMVMFLLKVANFILEDEQEQSKRADDRTYASLNGNSFTGSMSSNNSRTLFVEEPELNLHPKIQSRLADLFYEVSTKLHVQLVVETHSEYLVRKTQVIVAKVNNPRNAHSTLINPFHVYYMEGYNIACKEMRYSKIGTFIDRFGTGFYDTASNLAAQIIKESKIVLEND